MKFHNLITTSGRPLRAPGVGQAARLPVALDFTA